MDNLISVYPNPVGHGIMNIVVGNKRLKKVSIYDLQGKKVFSKSVNTQNRIFTIRDLSLSNGTYILEIVGDNFVSTQKLLFADGK